MTVDQTELDEKLDHLRYLQKNKEYEALYYQVMGEHNVHDILVSKNSGYQFNGVIIGAAITVTGEAVYICESLSVGSFGYKVILAPNKFSFMEMRPQKMKRKIKIG